MIRREFVLASALAASIAAYGLSAQAQDIGIGLDIPLSAPGDAAGGQLIRRGAEIGIDMVNVPYKDTGRMMTDLAAGVVQAGFVEAGASPPECRAADGHVAEVMDDRLTRDRARLACGHLRRIGAQWGV